MAEGEFQAGQRMLEAARLYMQAEPAMRLRELQTLAEIAREKNLIVVTSAGVLGTAVAPMAGMAAAMSKQEKKAEKG
jgi:hypothetical protein